MKLNTLNEDIKNNIKDYTIFKPKNKDELKKAVDLWIENKEEALDVCGLARCLEAVYESGGPVSNLACECGFASGEASEYFNPLILFFLSPYGVVCGLG